MQLEPITGLEPGAFVQILFGVLLHGQLFDGAIGFNNQYKGHGGVCTILLLTCHLYICVYIV